MNNYFNKLPFYVTIKSKKYKINVDFRQMINFEKRIQDNNISKKDKIIESLRYFYPYFYNKIYLMFEDLELYKEACDKLMWFYSCGKQNYHKPSGKGTPLNKVFNYDYDDDLIWEAFRRIYNLDLHIDKIHWWDFKVMLMNLPENCTFSKAQSYRAYTGKDKDMLALKEYWNLPLPKTEQERLNKIYESLK